MVVRMSSAELNELLGSVHCRRPGDLTVVMLMLGFGTVPSSWPAFMSEVVSELDENLT